jgi:two-component sensor histidine kinase
MSQNAPNPLLMLLDIVASPLLLFNAEGQVVFANQACKSMACRPALLLGSDPNVRALVKAIAQGQVVLDPEIRVQAMSDNGVAHLACRCAPRPIAGLVALAVSLVEDAVPQEPGLSDGQSGHVERLSLQQIMALLRGELLPPIQAVQQHSAAAPALNGDLQALHERLDRMVDLVNVFGEDVLIGEERMLVADMVRGICEELAPQAQQLGVSFALEGVREDLPPVYGSQRLMRRALFECLHNAMKHARSGVQNKQAVAVGVKFRASGQHLLINVSNIGVLSAAALKLHAATLFRPAGQAPPADAGADASLHIGLPLAQRVLQLHGGRLRIDQENEEISVMLELPTGAPLRNTHHLDLLQAQIYAEDLSKLMARSRTRSTA